MANNELPKEGIDLSERIGRRTLLIRWGLRAGVGIAGALGGVGWGVLPELRAAPAVAAEGPVETVIYPPTAIPQEEPLKLTALKPKPAEPSPALTPAPAATENPTPAASPKPAPKPEATAPQPAATATSLSEKQKDPPKASPPTPTSAPAATPAPTRPAAPPTSTPRPELSPTATRPPEVPRGYLREIGDLARDHAQIRNMGQRIWVVDRRDDPVRNWPAISEVAKKYAPGDKFRFYFYDVPEQVPPPPGPQKYDTNVYWSREYPPPIGGTGKQLRIKASDGVWEWHLSLPKAPPTWGEKLMKDITESVLVFFYKKDNVFAPMPQGYSQVLIKLVPVDPPRASLRALYYPGTKNETLV